MHALTAASPDLPFGSVLLLEREGRQVAVTITDRGPFAVDALPTVCRMHPPEHPHGGGR